VLPAERRQVLQQEPLNQSDAVAFIKANDLDRAPGCRLTDTAVDLTGHVGANYCHLIEIRELSPGDESSKFLVPVIFPSGGIVNIKAKLSSFKNISVPGVLLSFEAELRTKTLHGCPATSKLKLTSCDTLETFEGAPRTLHELHAGFAANIKSFAGLPATLKVLALDLFGNHSFSFEHLPDSVVYYELKELKAKSFKAKYPKSATDVGVDALNNVGELMLLPELKNVFYTGRFVDDRHRDAIIELGALMRRTSNPKARYYEAQQLLIERDMDDFF
jgi:hypothetical protein